MEPTLVVIGVNYGMASVAVRERFWISEPRRLTALTQLVNAEGIEEVAILATCNRTEFLVWADDAALAANSVLRFLSSEYGLQLCEWKHFYRLLDEAALLHIFRLASGLDSMFIGETQIIAKLKDAWNQSEKGHASGRYLDTVFSKALSVAKKVRHETKIGHCASLPAVIVEVIKRMFGSLADRKVVVLGAGKMSELAIRSLGNQGAASIRVLNRTFETAVELAGRLGATAVPFEDLGRELEDADVVISATASPHVLITRAEAERLATQRKGRPLCLVDAGVPRNLDPGMRDVPGIFLYDLDDLERAGQRHALDHQATVLEAETIVEGETKEFRRKLLAEHMVPTVVALRERLDQICRQELEAFRSEVGPFPKDQDDMLLALTSRITLQIAGALAREIREIPEKTQQEHMTEAVERLFHLKHEEIELVSTPLVS